MPPKPKPSKKRSWPSRPTEAHLWTAFPASSEAAQTDRYSIYASGRKIGHLTAKRDGAAVEIDFLISENGRGPRSKERVVLGETGPAAGLPISWIIDGAGLDGGADREELRYEKGEMSWRSAAEKGSHAGAPKLYVPATASPWAKELYARYGLARPGGRAEILPAGALKVLKRESLTVGEGDRALAVDLVTVSRWLPTSCCSTARGVFSPISARS